MSRYRVIDAVTRQERARFPADQVNQAKAMVERLNREAMPLHQSRFILEEIPPPRRLPSPPSPPMPQNPA
jgi:hypothetical protein